MSSSKASYVQTTKPAYHASKLSYENIVYISAILPQQSSSYYRRSWCADLNLFRYQGAALCPSVVLLRLRVG